jgi:glycosyltransferase involved in cell wall biosynthesis
VSAGGAVAAGGDAPRDGTIAVAAAERKVNVLILASHLWIGGAETVMRHLAETIDRQRFTVVVLCLKQRGSIGAEMAKAGIEVLQLEDEHVKSKPEYFTFRKVRRIVRERQIDVIHSHTTHGLVDATLCRLFTPGVSVVHTFHFGNYPHTRPRILWMERIFSRLATRLYAVGETQRGQIQAVYRLSDAAIGTIRNGVVRPRGGDGVAFRQQIGTGDRLLIGTIGTLIEQKGLRDVMRVARRLLDAGLRVQFVIVGEGALRKELEALRHELGLDEDVVLTGWLTSAADVALPAFDIFFQPSLWEAMSVVTLEAMASGKPVVATRVGEAPRIIEDGVDGRLVDPTDVDGMAAALRPLIEDAALRTRMGEAARRKINGRFTVAHMTRAYEAVYEDLAR